MEMSDQTYVQHNYFDVDLEAVWITAEVDLPKLKQELLVK